MQKVLFVTPVDKKTLFLRMYLSYLVFLKGLTSRRRRCLFYSMIYCFLSKVVKNRLWLIPHHDFRMGVTPLIFTRSFQGSRKDFFHDHHKQNNIHLDHCLTCRLPPQVKKHLSSSLPLTIGNSGMSTELPPYP